MSLPPSMPSTPAGWYPDPHVPGTLRYWDGIGWTQHTAPGNAPASSPTLRPPGEECTPEPSWRSWWDPSWWSSSSSGSSRQSRYRSFSTNAKRPMTPPLGPTSESISNAIISAYIDDPANGPTIRCRLRRHRHGDIAVEPGSGGAAQRANRIWRVHVDAGSGTYCVWVHSISSKHIVPSRRYRHRDRRQLQLVLTGNAKRLGKELQGLARDRRAHRLAVVVAANKVVVAGRLPDAVAGCVRHPA